MTKGSNTPTVKAPNTGYQAMIEHAPLPMAQADGPDHVVRSVNQAFCDLLKKRKVDLIGKPFAEVIPLKDVRLELMDQVERTGNTGTCMFPEGDGAQDVKRSYSCWPLPSEFGMPAGLMLQVTASDQLIERSAAINEALLISSVEQHERTSIADDLNESLRGELSEREHLTAILEASELQLRTMADSIPQMVWMARPDGHMFWYNKRWLEYTGTTLELGSGWNWQSLLDPAERPQVLAKITSAFARSEAWEDTFALRRHDGTMRWHLGRMMPVRDPTGTVVRWIGTYTDITDERKMEQELRQRTSELAENDRRKSEFLATLAHELRNPLAPLLNGLELLKMVADDHAVVEKTRRMMVGQVEHMVLLIEDLMDLSRITRGIIELRKEPVDLRVLIEQAVDASRPLIEKREHTLVLDLPEEPLMVEGDGMRLAQVFSNLLNNAAKYTDPCGAITVRALKRPTEASVTFEDNGIGIAMNELARIFHMFAQVLPTSDRVQGGLGIGLNIAKHLVEMHEGRIEVHSNGPHTGSRFTVHLPLAVHCAPAIPIARTPIPIPPPSPIKVLVVDDNEDATSIMAMMLTRLGHVVKVASDGKQALEMGKRLQPDFVLMDLGMPLMGGLTACRAMKKEPWGRAAYIVALTGWGQEEDRRRSTEAGFDHHLVKPVAKEALMTIIAHVAHRPASS